MKTTTFSKSYFFNLLKNPILINVMIVGVMTLVVKGMGFFKEMEVGRYFGLSELLDTFFIAALIPGFINNVFMSSFQNVFIPNYIAEKKISSSIGSFQSACVIITLGLGIVLSIVAYFFATFFLEDIFGGHTIKYYDLIQDQLYIMLPCILFWSLSSLLGGLLEVNGLFSFSSIYPIITSLVVLMFLFFFKNEFGYKVLALGMVVGSFIEFIYLLVVSIFKKTLKLSRPNFVSNNIVLLYRQLPSKIASGFLTGTTGFVNQFFAAQLVVGSIAALNYGMKIPAFLASILIISIGNVILPYFSDLVNENRVKAYDILYKSILYVFVLSLCIGCVIFFFSEEIISILFEIGNFSYNDTLVVSKIQKILLVYVPFYICSIIIIKFLTSINKNAYMVYASILNLVLNLVLNYYFARMYSVDGLAIATTIIYVINFWVLFMFVRYQQKKDTPK